MSNEAVPQSDKDTINVSREDLWLDERLGRIRAAGLFLDLDDVRRHLKDAIEFGRDLSKTPAAIKAAKKPKFTPPTVAEVEAYIRYLRADIDAQQFHDHYEANGWRQGSPGRPIKDWRACVRTWKNRRLLASVKQGGLQEFINE